MRSHFLFFSFCLCVCLRLGWWCWLYKKKRRGLDSILQAVKAADPKRSASRSPPIRPINSHNNNNNNNFQRKPRSSSIPQSDDCNENFNDNTVERPNKRPKLESVSSQPQQQQANTHTNKKKKKENEIAIFFFPSFFFFFIIIIGEFDVYARLFFLVTCVFTVILYIYIIIYMCIPVYIYIYIRIFKKKRLITHDPVPESVQTHSSSVQTELR